MNLPHGDGRIEATLPLHAQSQYTTGMWPSALSFSPIILLCASLLNAQQAPPREPRELLAALNRVQVDPAAVYKVDCDLLRIPRVCNMCVKSCACRVGELCVRDQACRASVLACQVNNALDRFALTCNRDCAVSYPFTGCDRGCGSRLRAWVRPAAVSANYFRSL